MALDELGGAALVAVSNLYAGRRTGEREALERTVFVTQDDEEMLARKDTDAATVVTPDHWHAQASIDAGNAGMEVYCKSRWTRHRRQQVVCGAPRDRRIIQLGSQRVSSVLYQKANENQKANELIVAIGKLNWVRLL